MSTPTPERGESGFNVVDRARRIRKAVNGFLLRDMGMKANKRDLRNSSLGKYRRLSDDSLEFYVRLPAKPERHNMVEDTFVFIPDDASNSDSGGLKVYEIPGWILEKYRDELWKYAREISLKVKMANKIYAYYPDEYHQRRKLQNEAMGCCYALHEILLSLTEEDGQNFPISIKSVMPIIRMLEEEIEDIKNWRKKENHVLITCYKHEAERIRKGYNAFLKECIKNCRKRTA